MAKKSYIGINSKARQIKKAYIGIDGVARKVKKIYMGVLGLARQIFGGGELIKKDIVLRQTTNHYNGVGTRTTNHALIIGLSTRSGSTSVGRYSRFEAIDNQLTVQEGTVVRSEFSAPSMLGGKVGEYAIVCGGQDTSRSGTVAYENYVSIDSKFTISSSNLPHVSSIGVNPAYIQLLEAETYLLIYYKSWYKMDEKKVLNEVSTTVTTTRNALKTSIGDYLVIGNVIYDEVFTRVAYPSIPSVGTESAVSANQKYVIWVGGVNSNTPHGNIYASDLSGTVITLPPYKYDISSLSTAKMQDMAVFWGGKSGRNSTTVYRGDVICFDDSLVLKNAEDFPINVITTKGSMQNLITTTSRSAVLDNYMFIAGGNCSNNTVWDGIYVYSYE